VVKFSRRRFLAAAAAIPAVPRAAMAQPYPARPVTIIVPFAAGGPSDAMARILGEHMSRTLGQSFLVENVTGAGGSIGVGRAVRSAPDGYTISFGHLGTHVFNGAIYRLPYDLVTDLEPLALLPSNPMVVVSKKTAPAKTLTELIAWLKANDSKITAGTAGAGSGSHIAGVYFADLARINLQYVPYRGTGPALNDLMAGQIDIMVDQTSNSMQQIRAGNIRAYAVSDKKRLLAAPDIPTAAEAGLPGFQMVLWSGLWMPRGTSQDVIGKLNAAVVAAMADAAVRQRFETLGLEIPPPDQESPQALGLLHKAEIAKWWPILKAADIKGE
jgi:tripartite-type tricarboxylate transporter receptor subunit TctC